MWEGRKNSIVNDEIMILLIDGIRFSPSLSRFAVAIDNDDCDMLSGSLS